jgi:hypothetical protein
MNQALYAHMNNKRKMKKKKKKKATLEMVEVNSLFQIQNDCFKLCSDCIWGQN